jgi:hypothetical protein
MKSRSTPRESPSACGVVGGRAGSRAECELGRVRRVLGGCAGGGDGGETALGDGEGGAGVAGEGP